MKVWYRGGATGNNSWEGESQLVSLGTAWLVLLNVTDYSFHIPEKKENKMRKERKCCYESQRVRYLLQIMNWSIQRRPFRVDRSLPFQIIQFALFSTHAMYPRCIVFHIPPGSRPLHYNLLWYMIKWWNNLQEIGRSLRSFSPIYNWWGLWGRMLANFEPFSSIVRLLQLFLLFCLLHRQ